MISTNNTNTSPTVTPYRLQGLSPQQLQRLQSELGSQAKPNASAPPEASQAAKTPPSSDTLETGKQAETKKTPTPPQAQQKRGKHKSKKHGWREKLSNPIVRYAGIVLGAMGLGGAAGFFSNNFKYDKQNETITHGDKTIKKTSNGFEWHYDYNPVYGGIETDLTHTFENGHHVKTVEKISKNKNGDSGSFVSEAKFDNDAHLVESTIQDSQSGTSVRFGKKESSEKYSLNALLGSESNVIEDNLTENYIQDKYNNFQHDRAMNTVHQNSVIDIESNTSEFLQELASKEDEATISKFKPLFNLEEKHVGARDRIHFWLRSITSPDVIQDEATRETFKDFEAQLKSLRNTRRNSMLGMAATGGVIAAAGYLVISLLFGGRGKKAQKTEDTKA